MKNQLCKKSIAILVVCLMLTGLLAMSMMAADGTEVEPSVVFWPKDMTEDSMESYENRATHSYVDTSIGKVLRLTMAQDHNDPYLSFFPGEGYNADDYKYVLVLVKSDSADLDTLFELFYRTEAVPNYTGGESERDRYQTNKDWQFLCFDFSEKEGWSGAITSLRFDFFAGRQYKTGEFCDIAAVIFAKDMDAAYDAAFDVTKTLFAPKQELSNFKDSEIQYFQDGGLVSTEITVENGDLVYKAAGNYNDPQAFFRYDHLADSRGIKKLTTADFRYVVFRYRTEGYIPTPGMELFILTGNRKSLMEMIRIEGTFACHSGEATYMQTAGWRGVMVDLAEDDGLEVNTGLKNGWAGQGAFNGFRFDWSGNSMAGASLVVSDILLYADKNAAASAASALGSMDLMTAAPNMGDGEDTTEHIYMPWETEPEETETLPVFSEETTAPPETESETEVDESASNSGTEDTEGPDETEETESSTGGGDLLNPDINIGDLNNGTGEEPAETGSQMPFYIACVALAGLSIASIAVVIEIRIREKM